MAIVARNLAPTLLECARLYPVVTVTGPRQSGKTILCRASFPDHAYISLEPLDLRSFALGIQTPEQLQVHPLQGAVSESWVAGELLKHRAHGGLDAGCITIARAAVPKSTWSWKGPSA